MDKRLIGEIREAILEIEKNTDDRRVVDLTKMLSLSPGHKSNMSSVIYFGARNAGDPSVRLRYDAFASGEDDLGGANLTNLTRIEISFGSSHKYVAKVLVECVRRAFDSYCCKLEVDGQVLCTCSAMQLVFVLLFCRGKLSAYMHLHRSLDPLDLIRNFKKKQRVSREQEDLFAGMRSTLSLQGHDLCQLWAVNNLRKGVSAQVHLHYVMDAFSGYRANLLNYDFENRNFCDCFNGYLGCLSESLELRSDCTVGDIGYIPSPIRYVMSRNYEDGSSPKEGFNLSVQLEHSFALELWLQVINSLLLRYI